MSLLSGPVLRDCAQQSYWPRRTNPFRLRIAVLEAQHRVGGRMYTVAQGSPEDGAARLDMGSMFVGAAHHRLRRSSSARS